MQHDKGGSPTALLLNNNFIGVLRGDDMKRKVDLTGNRFGRLTVIGVDKGRSGRDKYWLCKCDCGNTSVTTTHKLVNGMTRSCGCYAIERAKENGTKHGWSYTRLYRIWRGMKERCLNKNSKSYRNYGARGISVYPEWIEFEPFRDWAINNGYMDNLTIERIDVDGNYCPDNCKWATYSDQENNKRNTVRIEYNGETHSISEWSEIVGIGIETIRHRINSGWSIEEALTKPAQKRTRPDKIEFNGEIHTLSEWSRICGISLEAIRFRLARGWSVERTLTEASHGSPRIKN